MRLLFLRWLGWGLGVGVYVSVYSALTIMMNMGMLTFGVTDYVDRRFTLHQGAIIAGKPRDLAASEACQRMGCRVL